MRYLPGLMMVLTELDRSKFVQFVTRNAQQVMLNAYDEGTGTFGGNWNRPVDTMQPECSYLVNGSYCSLNSTGAAPQSSALDLFNTNYLLSLL